MILLRLVYVRIVSYYKILSIRYERDSAASGKLCITDEEFHAKPRFKLVSNVTKSSLADALNHFLVVLLFLFEGLN